MAAQMKYLETLDAVLKQVYKPWEYSLNGYSEDVLCMEMINGDWVVYRGSRGRKLDVRKYEDLLLACLVYITEINSSKSSTAAMRENFLDLALKDEKLKAS